MRAAGERGQCRHLRTAVEDFRALLPPGGAPLILDEGDAATVMHYEPNHVPDFYRQLIRLFVREAAQLAGAPCARCVASGRGGAKMCDHALYVSRPKAGDEDSFGVLLAGGAQRSSLTGVVPERFIVGDTGGAEEWGRIRATLSALFGFATETSWMRVVLEESRFVLTQQLLTRLLHLHGRRDIGAAVVLAGDTGVGKSFMLQLYSRIVNADPRLFVALRQQLSLVLRALGHSGSAFASLGRLRPSSPLEEMLNYIQEVVETDPEAMATTVGAAVCAHFRNVLVAYPLQLESVSAGAKAALARFQRLSPELQEAAWAVADAAAAENAAAATPAAAVIVIDHGAPTARTVQRFRGLAAAVGAAAAVAAAGGGAPPPATRRGAALIPMVDGAAPAAADAVAADEEQAVEVSLFGSFADLNLFIEGLVLAQPARLFRRVLAHEGLGPAEWRELIAGVRRDAEFVGRLSPHAQLLVFVDELNTAGAIGAITESFTAHRLDGEPLPVNVMFVGAINPRTIVSGDGGGGVADFGHAQWARRRPMKTSRAITWLRYCLSCSPFRVRCSACRRASNPYTRRTRGRSSRNFSITPALAGGP